MTEAERFAVQRRLAIPYHRAIGQGLRVPEPELLRQPPISRPPSVPPEIEQEALEKKRRVEHVIDGHARRHRWLRDASTTCSLELTNGKTITWNYWPVTGRSEVLTVTNGATGP
jgi:hypothetical protein